MYYGECKRQAKESQAAMADEPAQAGLARVAEGLSPTAYGECKRQAK